MTSWRTLNWALSLAFVVSLGLNWLVRRDAAQPNQEFFPNMAHSARFSAFAANRNFADGKTLQRPEPGTIPRGYPPLHYRATPEDALRAGEELSNPLSRRDANAVERGQFVYSSFCQPCHGASGRGDGLVVLRGFPAPPSLEAEHAVKMKDGQMFHLLAYGQGNMPSYASQVSLEERWQVILFVRSLQDQAAPPRGGKR